MGAKDEDTRPEPTELPAGAVALSHCLRCGRRMGRSAGEATPGAQVRAWRYICLECASTPAQYWR